MTAAHRDFKHNAIVAFSWLGILGATAFTYVNTRRGLPEVVLVDIGMFVLFAANLILYRMRGNTPVAGGIGLSVVMAFALLAAPRLGIAALVWMYIVPIPAFFFMGLRAGRMFLFLWGAAFFARFAIQGIPADLPLGHRLELLVVFGLASVTAAKLEQLRQEDAARVHALARTARDANETKGLFLTHMSHELRTPLNAILGFSQILGHKGSFPGELRPYLQKIRQSGTELLDMVDTILAFAKLNSGEIECQFQTFDLAGVVTEAVADQQSPADQHQLAIHTEMEPGIVIHGDPRLFRQVLDRLLALAMAGTPPGGGITIRSRVDRYFTLTVADTGCGLTGQDFLSVLDPIPDEDPQNRPARPEEDLGLSIVKLIAGIHGGRLESQALPGKGTEHSLVFPLSMVVAGQDERTEVRELLETVSSR